MDLNTNKIKKIRTINYTERLSTDEFIPEKSAEQIITELRGSRNFGKTRIIEPF